MIPKNPRSGGRPRTWFGAVAGFRNMRAPAKAGVMLRQSPKAGDDSKRSHPALVLVCLVERGLRLLRGFLLVLRLPLVVGHAVDRLTAFVPAHRNALGVGLLLHP